MSTSCFTKTHGLTLKTLVWDQRLEPQVYHIYNYPDLEDIFIHCPRLIELSMVIDYENRPWESHHVKEVKINRGII